MNIVSFSGGKDSTAVIILMKKNNIKIDRIVYYDTMMDFPQMSRHIDKVEKYAGVKIERIYPDRHPFYLMTEKLSNNKTYGLRNGYGWPTTFRRWCTAEKTTTLNKWRKSLAVADSVFYIGIAANENRPLDDKNKYPLIDFGYTEEMALKLCYSEGFDFEGLYNHFDRVSCWCCPLGGKKRARILYTHYPELWEKIKFIQLALFHDWGGHENFIEGKSYEDLEKEFNNYGQLDFFNTPEKRYDYKDYINNGGFKKIINN